MQWAGGCIPTCNGKGDVYPSMQWGRGCGRHPPRQRPPGQIQPGQNPPPPERRPLKRAVRILLECILILIEISRTTYEISSLRLILLF